MKIVLLGAGNVATHLGKALKKSGFEILQIYSHTESYARNLGELLGVSYCFSLSEIDSKADVYIYAVKDTVLEEVISLLDIPQAVHLHTAGSVNISIFEKKVQNYGVIYPLQTFSKNREINISEVPFFIEANNKKSEEKITKIIQSLGAKYYYLSSEKRELMHLAAVFACNFSNYMYVLASEITSEANIDFKTLLPLIKETAEKLNELSPVEAQTGPAIRNDEKTIKKHIELLNNNMDLQQTYTTLSESIQKMKAEI